MKKLLCLILIFTLLCPALAIHAEEKPISVVLNGKEMKFDVPPMLMNDRTMVPLRAIFEALGAKVDYDDTTKKITATLGNTVVTLRVDTPAMYVNGSEHMLDMPATVVDGRTLVPVRAVSEAFNCEVTWDGKNNVVSIKRKLTIYDTVAPKLDFTGDDGTKSKLHYNTRITFAQKIFPSLLYSNTDTFKSLMRATVDEATKVIDDQIWIPAMDDTAATYLLANDPNFEKLGNAAAIKEMDALADKYELWPHQSYVLNLFNLTGRDICLLVNIADIGEKIVLSEKDSLQIAPFIAVVYEKDTGKFHYLCLEKIDKKTYELCSYDKNLKRTAIDICENDKKAFVSAITNYIN